MLSTDYQVDQIQKIKVINKTGTSSLLDKAQKLSTVNQLTVLSHNLSLPLIGRDSLLYF